MKIYTKKGDAGKTMTASGLSVSKYDEKIEASGAVDETNSAIAMALLYVENKQVKDILLKLSHLIFNLGASISTTYNPNDIKDFAINAADVLFLEQQIDNLEKDLPKLHNFILPCGSQGAVFLHYARSIARRAERRVVLLAAKEELSPYVLAFMNRLSDLLFVLARYENLQFGGDILWNNNRKK